MIVISIADPEHPEEVGYFDTDGYAKGVTVSDDYAYVADVRSGLRVISVADPEHPYEVGFYDTPGKAYNVALSEDGLIYVADETNVGIYRFTDPNKVDNPNASIPGKFNLFAAYPNPFNSTTTIEYALPFPSQVSLNLYNLSGCRIETLFNGSLQAGTHRTTLNAGDLASGLYFVKLEGSEHTFTRKIMLVK